MRLESETEHQEKIVAGIADMKNCRKERTGCKEATKANPGEKEAVVGRKEIPNEEAEERR
jgi:hypothetical protein